MRWLIRRGGETAGGKRKPPRRPFALPRRIQLALRVGIFGGLAIVVVGGPLLLWQTGRLSTIAVALGRFAVDETRRAGFAVDEVLLEGRRLAPRAAVTGAVGLKRGDAIFGFDPAKVRERLVAIPWIRDAVVERRLPDTVRIRIIERRPMALWQRNGRLALVDDEGTVITDAPRAVARFRNLLIVVGPDAPRHAATLIAMIESEPQLARRVSAAVRVGERRWNVELIGDIRVELPETDPHDAWRRLARLQAREKLLERDVRTIDMRLPDRLIVRPGPIGGEAVKAKGQHT